MGSPRPEHQIIVALDTASMPAALTLLDQLSEVVWWKVGLELFTAVGASILQELRRRQKRIFLDIKLHDIPNTVSRAVRAALEYDVDLITLHALGGSEMMRAAQGIAAAGSCQLLAVTVLTSLSPEQLYQDLQISSPLPDYALHLAQLAQRQGIPGAVCSPQEVARLRHHCGPEFLLVTPGIRWSTPHMTSEDQARIWTPPAALQAGADYLVIGRPLTQAPDPAAAFASLCASLRV